MCFVFFFLLKDNFKTTIDNSASVEAAIVVLPYVGGMGIGTYMLTYLFQIAKREGKKQVVADVLYNNRKANALFSRVMKDFPGSTVEYVSGSKIYTYPLL